MLLDKGQKIEDMSNFAPKSTGLKYVIWVSVKVPRHTPRVKVAVNNTTISFSIGDNPDILVGNSRFLSGKEINDIKQWIVLNKDVLLDYWNMKIDTMELVNKIKKL